MASVLFLCTGNSARSQLAEAMLRHLGGDKFEAFSAGTDPQPIDERVFQVLTRQGVSSEGLTSKGIEALPRSEFDFVITLCDKANQECPPLSGGGAMIHWDFADPRPQSGIKPFEHTLYALTERLRLFVQVNSHHQQPQLQPTELFKALSDPTRLRILMLLEDERELCVCELTEALAESQPKISRHLAQLRDQQILADRRQGQWIFYQLADTLPDWARQVLATTRSGNGAQINSEKARLKAMGDRPERVATCCGK